MTRNNGRFCERDKKEEAIFKVFINLKTDEKPMVNN